MLEPRFEKALSSERVFPQVFASAGGNFDRVPAKERAEVLRVCAMLFTQRFVDLNRSDLKVYCPSRPAPLKVENWLLRAEKKFLNALPENALEAKKALARTSKLYPLLCIKGWSVDYCSVSAAQIGLSKGETHCLKVIDGWSLCLSDSKLPDDFGQSINSMALQMAREARAAGIKKKGPGRPNMVDSLVEQLQALYPKGIPNKSVKEIARGLRAKTKADFSDTTLRNALSKSKSISSTVR